jgi:hypothetical protein
MNIKLDVQVVHAPGVIENLYYEEVNGPLMGKPESNRVATKVELVEKINEQNARPERHQKPEDQHIPQQLQGFFPVGMTT